MTSSDSGTTSVVSAPPGWVQSIRNKLDPIFTPVRRETLSRYLNAAVFGLQGIGVLTADRAALWTQLGVAAIALLYALLFAGTALRALLYSFLLASTSLLLAYGIAKGVNWAIILASIGQAFGIVTAAAKAQLPGVVVDTEGNPV